MRSSWLALATKSARMRSMARSRVRSDSTTTARPPSASGGSIGTTVACTSRCTGTGRISSALCTSPEAKARSIASAQPGMPQHGADVGAEGRAGGGIRAPHRAVGGQHDQRVGQALDDGGVGALQLPHQRGARGDAAGQPLDLVAEVVQRSDGGAGIGPGPRIVGSHPADDGREAIDVARPQQGEGERGAEGQQDRDQGCNGDAQWASNMTSSAPTGAAARPKARAKARIGWRLAGLWTVREEC